VDFLNMILSEDNMRTLVTLVAIAVASIWQANRLEKRLDEKMDKRFNEQDKKFEAIDRKFEAIDRKFEDLEIKIDKKFDSFYMQLKTNDFAHLNNSVSELTFILEKNGFLKQSDREHINSKLDKS